MGGIFSKVDLEQIEGKKIDLSVINDQLNNFKTGFPKLSIHSPAIKGKGIIAYDNSKMENWKKLFEEEQTIDPLMFIPASGAATRMFKALLVFYMSNKSELNDAIVIDFFKNIKLFAFYNDLKDILIEKKENIEENLRKKSYRSIIKNLLTEEGLNYANLPKGLLKFHKYENESRMALEEQLIEASAYCKTTEGNVRLHFTVSPNHRNLFISHLENVIPSLQKKLSLKFDVTLSEQKESTDTISVDMANEPYRNEKGMLVFRPGGHGALLENLNQMQADIIFIKNIDNIVPDKLKKNTVESKKILAGTLLYFKQKIHGFLKRIDENSEPISILPEIIDFFENELYLILPGSFSEFLPDDQLIYIKDKLNRPIRVCGMVKNEGEPGGGPFFVKNEDGSISVQIVESSQIDLNDKEQLSIFNGSTHFNPVDIACSVKDYKGKMFDLLKYRNPNTGLITKKSSNGAEIKAQELPGLWNGGMFHWNTIFVEVPLITFNPVKIVNDLLREQHREL